MKTQEFYAYLRERERIRLRKEAGHPWPWTEDKILQSYKFTNVFREHDRTTRELIQNLYSQHQEAKPALILLNCAIARYFGTSEFSTALGWQNGFYPERIKKLAHERLAAKQRVFTGAYVITNQGIKAPKPDVVVDHFLTDLWARREQVIHSAWHGSWEETVALMATIKGFGGTGFMAKEITLDTMFFPHFWANSPLPRDYWTWTPVGPGAARGLKWAGGEGLVGIKELQDGQYLLDEKTGTRNWPATWRLLSPTDIQFGLCEMYKYQKTLAGRGTPRSIYRAPKE